MGNASTIDFFCGLDSDFTFVHDEEEPEKHYDGCGFSQEKCTSEACCEDIQTAISVAVPMTLEEIRECFISNMKSKGQ
jgi:hypothetical protein